MPAVASKKMGVSVTASLGMILRACSNSFFRWSGPMRSGVPPKVDTPGFHQHYGGVEALRSCDLPGCIFLVHFFSVFSSGNDCRLFVPAALRSLDGSIHL